ncbi:MAG TPA: beta-ketoacyl-[acyl-carrier-protein] synthase family protein [Planctomycetota bacterium]|nr:beta-ketoacyl-[acyl-carrier-protein] synthase family protein [Planctomycetota bacterium]
MREPVTITGVGVVSPFGVGLPANRRALFEGISAVADATTFDASPYPVKRCAEVPDFPGSVPRARDLRGLDRATQLALVAGEEALERAGLRTTRGARERFGLCAGTTLGGMRSGGRFLASFLERGPGGAAYASLLQALPSHQTRDLAARLALHGPAVNVNDACAAGASAIGLAVNRIRDRVLDLALAGGFDPMCEYTHAGFGSLHLITADAGRPFDRARSGFHLGEAAAFLVLESASHARARGARALGEIVGYGEASEGHHLTQPQPEGLGAEAAMRSALADAGLSPPAVAHLNAHGTATILNDRSEYRAMRRVFGEGLARIAVSANKGAVGHALGAAGALETLFAWLALEERRAPPSAGFREADPEFRGLRLDGEGPIPFEGAVAMSNSFGFGGSCASLLLRREGG